ncbi:MAG: hypothetical protein GX458_14225 [Phyllobacteriaceae bacterium]|nr:hypothetical protein [Phyllobacteriaceae bacterium]
MFVVKIATTSFLSALGLIATAKALEIALRAADARKGDEKLRFERRWVWPLAGVLALVALAFLWC